MPQAVLPDPGTQMTVIIPPDPLPLPLDFFPGPELAIKKSCQHVAHHVTGPDVHPSIFIDLPAEKPAAVGPLLPDNLRPRDIAGIVDQERSPSPQVMFLVSWKLRVAKVPKDPSGRPRYFPKSPWALSSTTAIRCRLARARISSISQATPA